MLCALLLLLGAGVTHGVISGAVVDPIDEYTFMVSYEMLLEDLDGNNYTSLCGGSLISPTTVLTAAHCLFDPAIATVHRIDLTLGALNVTDLSDGERFTIESPAVGTHLVVHANYWSSAWLNDANRAINTINNDLALIRLPRETKTQPVMVDLEDRYAQNSRTNILGYGQDVIDDESKSELLRMGELQPITSLECNTKSGWAGVISPGMMCSRSSAGQFAGVGDDGGPVVVKYSRDRHLQVAIVSFNRNNHTFFPQVDVELGLYSDFLISHVPDIPGLDPSNDPGTLLLPSWAIGLTAAVSIIFVCFIVSFCCMCIRRRLKDRVLDDDALLAEHEARIRAGLANHVSESQW